MLFSFQGKIWLATRNAQGRYEKQQFVGNAPSLQLQLQTETSQKMDSYTGNRLQIGELTRGKTATLNMTLDEWTPENLLLAFYGTQVAISSSTVTGEEIGRASCRERVYSWAVARIVTKQQKIDTHE